MNATKLNSSCGCCYWCQNINADSTVNGTKIHKKCSEDYLKWLKTTSENNKTQLWCKWQEAGKRFIEARYLYLDLNKEVNNIREQILKANKEPKNYLSYRIKRKAYNKVTTIYSKAYDKSLVLYKELHK